MKFTFQDHRNLTFAICLLAVLALLTGPILHGAVVLKQARCGGKDGCTCWNPLRRANAPLKAPQQPHDTASCKICQGLLGSKNFIALAACHGGPERILPTETISLSASPVLLSSE